LCCNAQVCIGIEKKLRGDKEAARRKILGMLAGEGLVGFDEAASEM
jgi:hypothetical protein